jgi:hypothetical protein
MDRFFGEIVPLAIIGVIALIFIVAIGNGLYLVATCKKILDPGHHQLPICLESRRSLIPDD